MARYSVLMRVLPRTEEAFTREQIEAAAKVVFYTHPPDECVINTPPDDLDLSWTADFIRSGRAVIVVGDVEPNAT